MLDKNTITQDFPILDRKLGHDEPLVLSKVMQRRHQKPKRVLEAVESLLFAR